MAKYADVWNVPTYALDRIDELSSALGTECDRIGRDPQAIRRSIEAVLVVAPAYQLDDATAVARRRFGDPGLVSTWVVSSGPRLASVTGSDS